MCGWRACCGRRPLTRRAEGLGIAIEGGGSRFARRKGCGESAAKVACGNVRGGAAAIAPGSVGKLRKQLG